MAFLRISPAGLAGTGLALLAVVVCVRLGFWQLDRHEQRKTRNALVAERLALPELELDGAVTDTAGLTYRRVRLEGEFDHARTVVWARRAYQGSPGAHVVTPLILADGSAVLVNRGWVYSADAATVDLSDLETSGYVALTGLVLAFLDDAPRDGGAASDAREGLAIQVGDAPGEFRRVWHRIDHEALRAQLPYPTANVYVQALPDADSPALPVRLEAPALDGGPHLGYALQWFAFALIALVGWIVVVARGRTSSRDAPPVPAGRG